MGVWEEGDMVFSVDGPVEMIAMEELGWMAML